MPDCCCCMNNCNANSGSPCAPCPPCAAPCCCQNDCEDNCVYMVENQCPDCQDDQDCECDCCDSSRVPCLCTGYGGTPIPFINAKFITDECNVNCCDQSVPINCCRAVYTCRLPERAKTCKPPAMYKPSTVPFEPETIYNQSYLPCEDSRRQPIKQNDNLCLGVGEFEKNTIQKLSYVPFCQIPECFITPFPNFVEIIRDEENCKCKKKKKKKKRNGCSSVPFEKQCYEFCKASDNSNVYNCYNNYVPWYSILRQCD